MPKSTKGAPLAMKTPPIVSPQEWGDARGRMPWMAVEKDYAFEGPKGRVSLLDLFEGRRQLIVYRAFFEPGVFGWPEHACRGCSLGADQVSHLAHLNARDTTLVYASPAPQKDIQRLKAQMGWAMPWYTITDSFDKDFGVDEWHGHNAFIRDGESIFRTYFINNRGDEQMGNTCRRIIRRHRRTNGGTGTTTTTRRHHLIRSGSKFPRLEKLLSESATRIDLEFLWGLQPPTSALRIRRPADR